MTCLSVFVGGGEGEPKQGQLQRNYKHKRDLNSYLDYIEKLT